MRILIISIETMRIAHHLFMIILKIVIIIYMEEGINTRVLTTFIRLALIYYF